MGGGGVGRSVGGSPLLIVLFSPFPLCAPLSENDLQRGEFSCSCDTFSGESNSPTIYIILKRLYVTDNLPEIGSHFKVLLNSIRILLQIWQSSLPGVWQITMGLFPVSSQLSFLPSFSVLLVSFVEFGSAVS